MRVCDAVVVMRTEASDANRAGDLGAVFPHQGTPPPTEVAEFDPAEGCDNVASLMELLDPFDSGSFTGSDGQHAQGVPRARAKAPPARPIPPPSLGQVDGYPVSFAHIRARLGTKPPPCSDGHPKVAYGRVCKPPAARGHSACSFESNVSDGSLVDWDSAPLITEPAYGHPFTPGAYEAHPAAPFAAFGAPVDGPHRDAPAFPGLDEDFPSLTEDEIATMWDYDAVSGFGFKHNHGHGCCARHDGTADSEGAPTVGYPPPAMGTPAKRLSSNAGAIAQSPEMPMPSSRDDGRDHGAAFRFGGGSSHADWLLSKRVCTCRRDCDRKVRGKPVKSLPCYKCLMEIFMTVLDVKEASRRCGMSPTTFKKRLRKVGIKAYPSRKIRCLIRCIKTKRAALLTIDDESERMAVQDDLAKCREELRNFRNQLECMLCRGGGDSDDNEDTIFESSLTFSGRFKKIRNKIHKHNYKCKKLDRAP